VATFEFSKAMYDHCIPEKTMLLKYDKYMVKKRSFYHPNSF